ncbi:MAG: hypothetical protein M1829_002996 [Trizodia sp. TS-e1964]|nr:MAG: hypothetical protein M1829_002996 [Trizodia sp. TS-e1964]
MPTAVRSSSPPRRRSSDGLPSASLLPYPAAAGEPGTQADRRRAGHQTAAGGTMSFYGPPPGSRENQHFNPLSINDPRRQSLLYPSPSSASSSLSSPFNGYNPSNFAAGGPFPQPSASRGPGYNPQEWRPPNANSAPRAAGYAPHLSYTATRAGGHNQEDGSRAQGLKGCIPEEDMPVCLTRQQAFSYGPPPEHLADQNPIYLLAPPPPYSPQRRPPGAPSPSSSDSLSPSHNHVSPLSNSALTALPASSSTSTSSARSTPTQPAAPHTSPNPGAVQSFPPPPPPNGQKSRSSSSNRHDRREGLFSLSALTSRSKQNNAGTPTPPDFQRPAAAAGGTAPIRTRSEAPQPPGSRRAASAGVLGSQRMQQSSQNQPGFPDSTGRWEPGMPLPPPPPGLPPGPRSQSLSRSPVASSPSQNIPSTPMAAPPTRRPPMNGSLLSPMPPTPADWVNDDNESPRRSPVHPLRIQTANPPTKLANVQPQSVFLPEPPREELSQLQSHKDLSAKGLRERRSESRTGRGRVAEPLSAAEGSNNPWAEDLVKPLELILPANPSSLSRHRANKTTPKSGRPQLQNLETPKSADSSNTLDSDTSTPRFDSPHPVHSPFQPSRIETNLSRSSNPRSPYQPPKPLPTPPLLSGESRKPLTRPVAHLIQTASSDSNVSQPTSPRRPLSRLSISSVVNTSVSETFARSAIDRHNAFASREASAKSDRERVQLFAEFIVSESRIRRERYVSAIDAMGSEILELTRDLFRPYPIGRPPSTASLSASTTSDWPRESPTPASLQGSLDTSINTPSPSQSSKVEDSPASATSNTSIGRTDSALWGGYMPSLSPIPSMSVSDAPDEMSSRGRPPSRWWEASQEGSLHGGGGGDRLGRSKRESKYMGMPRELRESLQWDSRATSNSSENPHLTVNMPAGTSEYPPEKVGWHEEQAPSLPPPTQPLHSNTYNSSSTPQYSPPINTPDPRLDVSRLVTLPPPYPRHHPAVNNNHPDLTSLRDMVRSLSDLTEIVKIKEDFASNNKEIREDAQGEARKRRSFNRMDIHRKIEAGAISFADAAKIEASIEAEEREKEKQLAQAEFERFQSGVVKSVNSILLERITRATASFDQLRSKLFNDAQHVDPNMTQEEGDEQPELLEKLTLLKWLFEAREVLHREMYDLLSERNNKYKLMVITPYALLKNEEKIQEAEAFFRKDSEDRKMAFEKDTLTRLEEFLEVIEQNVMRGVEVQLSAFWDIAPALLTVTEKIPSKLSGFQIQIPPDEYEENPSYHQFPMQYLHSLLTHAEKSTYQFIESQTNLLCLLHEARSSLTAANCRLMETQRYLAGEAFASIDSEMREVKRDEERRLTDDLKEKVSTVEQQWNEALGARLTLVKERIASFLLEHGGWDEDAQA